MPENIKKIVLENNAKFEETIRLYNNKEESKRDKFLRLFSEEFSQLNHSELYSDFLVTGVDDLRISRYRCYDLFFFVRSFFSEVIFGVICNADF